MYFVYMIDLDCAGKRNCGHYNNRQAFYTGSTDDIVRRFIQHSSGSYSNYISRFWKNARKSMVYAEIVGNRSIALRREKEVKKLSHTSKIRLISSEQNIIENPIRYNFGRLVGKIKKDRWFRSNYLARLNE